MVNLLLSIKSILHDLVAQTIYIIIFLVTVHNAVVNIASAPIRFRCEFSELRHSIGWKWRQETVLVWIRSFNNGGFAQITQTRRLFTSVTLVYENVSMYDNTAD